MPLSALEKVWQFDVNRTQAATGAVLTTSRQLWRGIKNRLIAFPILPWTVRYSCDSVAAGTVGDGVDRWAADTNLVWASADASGVRSWIVLRNTDGVEILIECRNPTITVGKGLRIVMSPAAHFTGGSTTTRPTATDEMVILNGDSPTPGGPGMGNANHSGDRAYAYHLLHSTDGLVTMVVICHAGNATGFWYFGRASQPVTGWTMPVLGAVWGDDGIPPIAGPSIDIMHMGTLSDATNPHALIRQGSTNGKIYATCEAFGTGSLGTSSPTIREILVANEISGTWQLPRIGLASRATGVRGVHGRLFDVSWAPEVRQTGEGYPNDGTRTRMTFGDILIPWNGSVAVAA